MENTNFFIVFSFFTINTQFILKGCFYSLDECCQYFATTTRDFFLHPLDVWCRSKSCKLVKKHTTPHPFEYELNIQISEDNGTQNVYHYDGRLVVHFGLAFATKHGKGIEGKSFHLVFTWEATDWSKEADALAQTADDVVGVGKSTG